MTDIIKITDEADKTLITAANWWQCHPHLYHFKCDICKKELHPGIRLDNVLFVCHWCPFTKSVPEFVVEGFEKYEDTEEKRTWYRNFFIIQNFVDGMELVDEEEGGERDE